MAADDELLAYGVARKVEKPGIQETSAPDEAFDLLFGGGLEQFDQSTQAKNECAVDPAERLKEIRQTLAVPENEKVAKARAEGKALLNGDTKPVLESSWRSNLFVELVQKNLGGATSNEVATALINRRKAIEGDRDGIFKDHRQGEATVEKGNHLVSQQQEYLGIQATLLGFAEGALDSGKIEYGADAIVGAGVTIGGEKDVPWVTKKVLEVASALDLNDEDNRNKLLRLKSAIVSGSGTETQGAVTDSAKVEALMNRASEMQQAEETRRREAEIALRKEREQQQALESFRSGVLRSGSDLLGTALKYKGYAVRSETPSSIYGRPALEAMLDGNHYHSPNYIKEVMLPGQQNEPKGPFGLVDILGKMKGEAFRAGYLEDAKKKDHRPLAGGEYYKNVAGTVGEKDWESKMLGQLETEVDGNLIGVALGAIDGRFGRSDFNDRERREVMKRAFAELFQGNGLALLRAKGEGGTESQKSAIDALTAKARELAPNHKKYQQQQEVDQGYDPESGYRIASVASIMTEADSLYSRNAQERAAAETARLEREKSWKEEWDKGADRAGKLLTKLESKVDWSTSVASSDHVTKLNRLLNGGEDTLWSGYVNLSEHGLALAQREQFTTQVERAKTSLANAKTDQEKAVALDFVSNTEASLVFYDKLASRLNPEAIKPETKREGGVFGKNVTRLVGDPEIGTPLVDLNVGLSGYGLAEEVKAKSENYRREALRWNDRNPKKLSDLKTELEKLKKEGVASQSKDRVALDELANDLNQRDVGSQRKYDELVAAHDRVINMAVERAVQQIKSRIPSIMARR